jgi:hypothetical protein
MPSPTAQMWEEIAHRFEKRWNFPNCIGAIDGKHCVIKAPPNSGSKYYNYKGAFSIVLLAVVDADYRFTMLDIGDYGSNSDGGIFANSEMGKKFCNEQLHVPGDRSLPHFAQEGDVPLVVVGDAAFPSRVNLLRPYPRPVGGTRLQPQHRIFNYRLSRACRMSENVFGIITQRFQIFDRRMKVLPENAQLLVQAACVLQNYITRRAEAPPALVRLVRPTPRQIRRQQREDQQGDGPGFEHLANIGINAAREAKRVRDVFSAYFNSDVGSVSWQNASVFVTEE